ncbi:MAG: phosphatidate cytidylyltransferase, partial [bacterium]|nr:phosphatidate cytidylyltransferase [bacterium]
AAADERARSSVATASFKRRVVVGVGLAVVGIGSIFYQPAFDVLVYVIAVGALWELHKLDERKGSPLHWPVALAAVTGYVVLASFGRLPHYERDLIGLTILVSFLYGLLRAGSGYLLRTAVTVIAVLYIGKLISYYIVLRNMAPDGLVLTIYAVVLVALTDTASMLWGLKFGRHRLTPISPKKTVEGAIGGLLTALIFGVAAGVQAPLGFSPWQAALIATVTSSAAILGDLVESALKRDARVKDAGSAISGHGGVLDRFDSYLFSGIAYYWMLHLLRGIPFAR